MNQALEIHHDLADVVVQPNGKVDGLRLKEAILSALDLYWAENQVLEENRVPAKVVHDETRQRHGDYYQTSGYYLRLFRQRADLTQEELGSRTGILQHHLSEIENNKRVLGKSNARKLAKILDCDYRRLL